jgi:hypothetical protein
VKYSAIAVQQHMQKLLFEMTDGIRWERGDCRTFCENTRQLSDSWLVVQEATKPPQRF